jgi:hypothetical protein
VVAGDLTRVWLTVTNVGANAANGVVPAIVFSDPAAGDVVTGPVPAGPAVLASGATQTYAWTIRARRGGAVGVTASVAGTDAGDASLVSAQVAGSLTVADRFDEEIVVYPVPVSGDGVTIALKLKGAAETVDIEVYNAAFQRVYRGTWRSVSAWDNQFTVNGVSAWAVGPYLVKAKAGLADGTTQKFPVMRMLVKR